MSATGWPLETAPHDDMIARVHAFPTHDGEVFTLDGRSVLVAVDSSPASSAAIQVAHALATEHGAVIHAVSVLDDRSVPIPPPLDVAIGLADGVVGPAIREQREAELHDQLVAVLGEPVRWPRQVHLGNPPAAIGRMAKDIDAALIVMGLRRHGKVDRALHDETTLNTIRHAPCPVLAVAEGMTKAPSRILAAVDFSPISLDSTRVARQLLKPHGRLHLAYVPPSFRYRHGDGEGVIHDLGVTAGFEQLERELGGDSVIVDHVVLHHDAHQRIAELLLEHASAVRAHVISAGSVGRTLIDRWLIGSVSTDLVRDGRHSLLITPLRDLAGVSAREVESRP